VIALPVLGVLLAIVVDVAIPAALLWRWARLNRRQGESVQSDRRFWRAIGVYACWMALWVVLAIATTFSYEGTLTLFAVFFTLPFSAIPAIFNSNVIHHFFTNQEWACFWSGLSSGRYCCPWRFGGSRSGSCDRDTRPTPPRSSRPTTGSNQCEPVAGSKYGTHTH
jgi:hypothetical protein